MLEKERGGGGIKPLSQNSSRHTGRTSILRLMLLASVRSAAGLPQANTHRKEMRDIYSKMSSRIIIHNHVIRLNWGVR